MWQPLAELSSAPADGADAGAAGEAGRRALLGLQLLLLSLARAQVQMMDGELESECLWG